MRTPPKTGGEYGDIKKRELYFLATDRYLADLGYTNK